MMALPATDEALVRRMLPSENPDPQDRARAWAEWHWQRGGRAVLSFIRSANNTPEPDEDILQDAMLTAYVEVERGHYEHRAGIPFTAYVKGIARNKIREARRRTRNWEPLETAEHARAEHAARELENSIDSAEQARALRRGLASLPAARREVLERYLRGDSPAEIAQGLHMTEATVRQHKHRGLRRLQELALLG